ncbi:MAG: UDP-glucose/GDP-mannose dehydrogenase family protein [Cytophagia bacterium]|jgi:UDPglucose 6-dehydrogenase|nr:UDP-glucose/GDP-mannose dehydrogenase family protein [Cytophagia bacterium]
MNVSFIGLGKLGLPLASCLSNSGNKILGIDKNKYFIDKLNRQELPFYEPELDEVFDYSNFIGFTDSYDDIFEKTDSTIILVNTQDENGGYSSLIVEKVLEEFSQQFKTSTKDYHLIVLSSTVLPGTISKLIKLVEDVSGKKYEQDFGFSYVPDFVKLGSVIKDFRNPEFFLVGANNDRDVDLTKSIWEGFHENNPPERILTLEEAEISKVALNAFIVNKITFANFLGQLCDGIKNVDVHNITSTIGLDKRISPYFFGYGTPYGGTCFPRDTTAFIKFAEDRKKIAKHLIFAEEVNFMVYQSIFDKVKTYKKIAILGISFKPNSPVTIGSPSVNLIMDLKLHGKEIYCHDFIEETFENLDFFQNMKVKTCNQVQECIDNSEVVVIMHPDKRYQQFDYTRVNVVDYWGILK